MAATVAAHWYQQELGASSGDEATSRFPFLRMPYKRRNTKPNQLRPTSAKSSKSFQHRPTSSRSNVPISKTHRRPSISVQSTTSDSSTPTMKQGQHQQPSATTPKSRAAFWRRKLGVQLIPPLAYYGWGSAEEVKRVAQQSKPTTSVPPNVRTATSDQDDLIDEAAADDMILLTEMRAPSALGGMTLVESSMDDDVVDWPLTQPVH